MGFNRAEPICYRTNFSLSQFRLTKWSFFVHSTMTSRTVLAHKMDFCIFFCLQEPIIDVLVIFFCLKLEVYVRLVKSLLILSFYLSKQLKESPITQHFGVKPLKLCNNNAVVGICKCVLQRHFDVNYYWIKSTSNLKRQRSTSYPVCCLFLYNDVSES